MARAHSAVRVVALVLLWAAIAVGAVAWALGRWIVRNFGHITPDQALMNLQGAGEGAGGTYVSDAIWQTLILPLALVFLAWLVVYLIARQRHTDRRSRSTRLCLTVSVLALIAVPVAGAWSMGSALQVRQYLAAHDPSLDLSDYYQTPIVVGDTSGATNLVLIYLESMEDSFGDADFFGTNMLAPIQQQTATWDTIPNFQQYPAGGWTMSGIVSTQCGFPLRMPPSSGIEGTETLDHSKGLNKVETESYLPGATCLGDVLTELGYTNVFMGGADSGFAAKGQFLRNHGYDRVMDIHHWVEVGEDETSSWGLSDGRLFANAETVLTELEDAGHPFMLTLLTLDTHDPAPQFDYCTARTEYPLADAAECSMAVVSDFLKFMEDRGSLESTAVVIMGDHLKFLTTGENLGADFSSYPDRTIFNRISSPVAGDVRVDKIDQLDMYPTILEAMGISVENGRAALGVSAYNPDTVIGSLRQLEVDERETMVRSRSADFYAQMWGE